MFSLTSFPWGLLASLVITGSAIAYSLFRLRRAFLEGSPLPPLTQGTPSVFTGITAEASSAFRGFGWRFTTTFSLLAAAALLVYESLLGVFGRLVAAVGGVAFWPGTWSGLLAPDFVFLLFLILFGTLSFVVGFEYRAVRMSMGRRLRPAFFLVAYALAAAAMDVALSGVRTNEAYTIIPRAILGGGFYTAALWSTFSRPRPILVSSKPRNHRNTLAFAASAVWAGLTSIFVVYLVYPYWASSSNPLLDVAFFLLIPSLGSFFFIVFGLSIYKYIAAKEASRFPSLEQFHPPVSIIIPAYNEESGIAETIRRADAAAAEYPGTVEIIVGNDGSTDRTSEVATAALSAMEHAIGRCVDLPHGGKSNALNGALLAAQGELVIRIDADTPIVRFAPLIRYFHDPDVGEVQGRILPARRSGWVAKLRVMEIMWTHLFLRRAQMATGTLQVVSGLFCAFRRDHLLEAGGWVPWNGEDAEITLRFIRLGYKMRLDLESLAYEDTPRDFKAFQKQRIRWNRGGYFAHAYHFGAIFGPLELGGLAFVFWIWQSVRSARRYLVYVFSLAASISFQSLDVVHVLILIGLLFAPRVAAIGFFLVRWGYWRVLPWIFTWPGFWVLKSYVYLESIGTMLPGNTPEFSD